MFRCVLRGLQAAACLQQLIIGIDHFGACDRQLHLCLEPDAARIEQVGEDRELVQVAVMHDAVVFVRLADGQHHITYNKDVAKLSVVGAGMMSNPGVASRMFEALYNSRVNINMISTSEIRITVLVAEKDIDKAMNAVHDEFIMEE